MLGFNQTLSIDSKKVSEIVYLEHFCKSNKRETNNSYDMKNLKVGERFYLFEEIPIVEEMGSREGLEILFVYNK